MAKARATARTNGGSAAPSGVTGVNADFTGDGGLAGAMLAETVADVDAEFSGEGFTQAQAHDNTNPATPAQYPPGSLRQDPASMAVAIRTTLVTQNGIKDWMIATVDRGGHYASWTDVQGWDEVEVVSHV